MVVSGCVEFDAVCGLSARDDVTSFHIIANANSASPMLRWSCEGVQVLGEVVRPVVLAGFG